MEVLKQLLCACLLLLFINPVRASSVLEVGVQPLEQSLGQYLSYFEDPDGQMDIQAIRELDSIQGFQHNTNDKPNFGFTDSVYWFRFVIRNSSSQQITRLLEAQYPLLDYLSVYQFDSHGALISKGLGGDRYAFGIRPIKTRTINFLLTIAPHTEQTVYIKVKTASSMQLPFVMWDLETFRIKDHDERMLLGMYYGTIAAMWLFSLIVLISSRDRSYFFYCFYIVPFFLFQFSLNGLSYEYLWPNAIEWANEATPFFIAVTTAAALQFNRSYLNLKDSSFYLNRVYLLFISLSILCAFGAIILEYSLIIRIATILGMVSGALVFMSSFYCLVKGIRQAPYIVLAWALYMIGVMVYSLKSFKLLPSIFLTEYGMQIGSSLEVIMLAFALVHRLQSESTSLLEERVEARTQELNRTLKELAHVNASLKQLSMLDGLTQVKNRKFFDEHFERELRRAYRENTPLTLVLFDIDHFKRINDTYGHPAGDECLRHLCQTVGSLFHRPGDSLARLGGEEFAILLPDTTLENALNIAETIRHTVETDQIVYKSITIKLTISLGVSSTQNKINVTPSELLVQADQALYRAKNDGRNRVCAYSIGRDSSAT